MAHEIYYTSAPQGVKPGQQGFCTVATSPSIPKPLWDRLESISGYRHPFEPGSDRNPVAWSHMLMTIGGRETSVLSRVCDAGLDYTQRTNAFAHHVALDAAERAAGGPAWMLRQSGVLAPRWDGQVGEIRRPAPLPRGDASPRVCSAWKAMTGDAGWAGVLAETASRNARRPVCILYSPEQDLLPLIAEAIALLPHAQRWQVTFSTYFTSLPGSAQCAWRCCIAGTPAAAEAARHAGGWLMLDLTDPARLGAPKPGPLVEMARTGRSAGVAVVAPAPVPAAKRTPFTRFKSTAAPVEEVPISDEALDLAPEPAPDVLVEIDAPAEAPVQRSGWFGRGRKHAEKAAGSSTISGTSRAIDTSWDEMRAQMRRRWLIGGCFVALAFVAFGTWLQMQSNKTDSSAPLPPPSPAATQRVVVPDVGEPPVVVIPPRPPETQIVIVPTPEPVTPEPTTKATDPTPTPVRPSVERPPPQPIVLAAELQHPEAGGAGIGDIVQRITIPPAQFDDLRGLATFGITLPGNGSTYAMRNEQMNGTLSVKQDARDRFKYVVSWRDEANPLAGLEVGSIALVRTPPKLEVTWKTSLLLRRPDVIALARAVLQSADMQVALANGERPQKISFRPAAPVQINLAAAEAQVSMPSIPPGASIAPRGDLPSGWQMTIAPEPPDPAKPAERRGMLLTFENATTASPVTCSFTVRLAADWKSTQSTWGARQEVARSTFGRLEAELALANGDIEKVQKDHRTILEPLEKRVMESREVRKLPDTELEKLGTNRKILEERIRNEEAAWRTTRQRLEEGLKGIIARRDETALSHKTYKAAVETYDQLREVELTAELPAGVRVLTLKLVK